MNTSVMADVRTKIGEGGRVIIPAFFRQQLHLQAGDDIILHLQDDEITLTTSERALRKLQKKVRNYLKEEDQSISLVDELIAMRRAEAKEEAEHD